MNPSPYSSERWVGVEGLGIYQSVHIFMDNEPLAVDAELAEA
jgi:hypothetical protein